MKVIECSDRKQYNYITLYRYMYSYIYFDLTHVFYSIPEKSFRKKLILKKKQQTSKDPQKLPSMQRVKRP